MMPGKFAKIKTVSITTEQMVPKRSLKTQPIDKQ